MSEKESLVFYGCLVVLVVLVLFLLIAGQNSALKSGDNKAVLVKIIALNDFHSHLSAGQRLNGHPAGGAQVLSSAVKDAINHSYADHTLLALVGDTIGASPRQSALLLDEPTILFFNSITGNRTPLISIPGNHEFDRGVGELMRMITGGNGTTMIPHLVDPYPGMIGDEICANVVWKDNQTPLFPPYVIREMNGIPVAWIGVVTTETTGLTLPRNIEGLQFLNETETVNRYVHLLQNQGVHAFVVLLHEGGSQDPYEGQTREGANVTGPIVSLIAGMDPDMDVVFSAHTHAFTNAYLPNAGGKEILVVQAYSYGMAYAVVDLQLDPVSRDICKKSAAIIPVYADQEIRLDADAGNLVDWIEMAVHQIDQKIICVSPSDITRSHDGITGSTLGRLVARSQQDAMGADLALVTSGTLPGSVHADLKAGNITFSDLESVLPADAEMANEYGGWFSRPRVASRELNGTQIKNILERQYETPAPQENVSVSGLSYQVDLSRADGDRVTDIRIGGEEVAGNKTYLAAMNYYIAYGRGNFSPGWEPGVNVTVGPEDIDMLIGYIRKHPASWFRE